MTILDGRTLAQEIINSLKTKDLSALSLHIILVGDDSNSQKYIDLKQKRCHEIGLSCVIHRFPSDIKENIITSLTQELNTDSTVSGYFIQLPMPASINKNQVISTISPKKDVDGLTPNSKFIPAVVRGVMSLISAYPIVLAGKNAVIINDSKLIGIPLKNILEKENCHVQICNKFTENIQKISRGADFLFSATGVKGLVTRDYIKPGAIVVDIGGGDVDFANVSDICSYITPTVGGVGPMTIASLLQNLVDKT
ncbi:bifunctional 5,10-methylenetetrahydrofolate dehydrogenase/5,10-methenyltetrahydrofolate cyclohydrolase [Candidatus Shapirobacteria bacterium]|nr:bifunctional 5,10-methylenetetrahydrofolate dehydrogenase/5,10-methenyltetrahydrofolate cyclohydrolase [Candidatus Shapirobacteria bacterium]